jgi:hypothetical protein
VRREWINILLVMLLVAVAGILLFSLLPERQAMYLFENSDALYMPALYQDLFVHRSGLSVWHLNGAPNFFPEMLLFFPLMAVLKSTSLTIMVYGVVQMLLIMFLMDRFLHLADMQISKITRYLVLLSFLLFPLSAVLNEGVLIPSQLLLAGYHAGFLVNSLLAAVLALSYLKYGGWHKLLILGLLTLVAVISDKLFIMGFVAPCILSSLLHLFQKGKKKSYLVLITLAGLTTLLALFIYRMMNFLPAIDMISTGTKMFQFDQIPKAMGNFLHHMKSVIIEYPIQRLLLLATLLFILGAPVFLIRHLSLYLARKLNPGMDNSYALILYLSLFVLLILFTPIINGYYVGRSLIRYNYAALVIGAAGFVYLAAVLLSSYKAPRWFKKYFTRACTTLLLAILLMVGVKNQALKGLRNYVNHYPESVRVLDELKREHGLAYGLSGYWQAKHSTMFSRNNLRLYAVSNGSFKPSYHVTNENWFHDGGKGSHANPVFNFLETSAFNDTEKLKELFGKHIDTLYDQNDLLVIKVPDFKMERESREIYLLDP